MIPAWAKDLAAELAGAVVKLITADNDADREEAAMRAAEATKAALDRAKFGDG